MVGLLAGKQNAMLTTDFTLAYNLTNINGLNNLITTLRRDERRVYVSKQLLMNL